ncbi:MAG: hypothetical protein V1782_08690 [Pseudomonadota bacterium]
MIVIENIALLNTSHDDVLQEAGNVKCVFRRKRPLIRCESDQHSGGKTTT